MDEEVRDKKSRKSLLHKEHKVSLYSGWPDQPVVTSECPLKMTWPYLSWHDLMWQLTWHREMMWQTCSRSQRMGLFQDRTFKRYMSRMSSVATLTIWWWNQWIWTIHRSMVKLPTAKTTIFNIQWCSFHGLSISSQERRRWKICYSGQNFIYILLTHMYRRVNFTFNSPVLRTILISFISKLKSIIFRHIQIFCFYMQIL